MTPRSVFSVHAPIAIGFAIPLLAAPEDFLWLYGLQADETGAYLSQLLGAALAAIAVITWLARDAEEGAALDALCGGFAIGCLFGTLAALYHQLTDPTVNALGWTTVAVYAGLFAAYAELWLGRAARRRPSELQAG
jgi:hypothetical protein